MNPPFGAQYANRKADRIFLSKAIELCNAVYSLHMENSKEFIKKLVEKNGWVMHGEKSYRFPVKSSFFFHEKRIAYFDVVMIYSRKT